ncbi:hypothetical protein TNCV_4072591 [Trichonephila clavipes]|uniref:Uncharacterized protein n=1 Tax=Trichonephila clavipes TaxID=2585209 RepID=A0A8X6W8Y1_TRICX|nr:hypothetical protein TNCV_4072591 [Trichonephila clavipes]
MWSGREKKKREIGMARKMAENRERSLGFPGTSVMQNATVEQSLTTVSPNGVCLQAEAECVIKHNVVPFRCPCPPFIAPLTAQTNVVSVKGKRSNGRF